VPVKWSAVRVIEATDMIEEYVSQAVEPLEQVRIVAGEALKIPDLPEYISQHIRRLIGEVDRAIGGSQFEPVGRLRACLDSIRNSIPDGAIKAEKDSSRYGATLAML
jgi:hypothetical protein